MRIGVVRCRYSDYGGGERYAASLTERLAAAGHSVTIFASEWLARVGGGVTVSKIKSRWWTPAGKAVSFARSASRAICPTSLDVVLALERVPGCQVYRAGDGCHAEWLVRRAAVSNWWRNAAAALRPFHWAMLSLERELFSHPELRFVIVNSLRGRDEILRHYGSYVSDARVRLLRNPIDASRFGRDEECRQRVRLNIGLADRPVVLFVGSGFFRKGLDIVLKAMAFLDNEVELLVAGRGSIPKYRRLAKQLGISDRVHLLGPVEDPAPLYSAADCFCLPAIYEPFGSACLEALAAGLPVVTTRVTGASELIRHGVTGLVLEDNPEPEAVAQALKKTLSLVGQPMFAPAARAAVEGLSWPAQLAEILDILAVARK